MHTCRSCQQLLSGSVVLHLSLWPAGTAAGVHVRRVLLGISRKPLAGMYLNAGCKCRAMIATALPW